MHNCCVCETQVADKMRESEIHIAWEDHYAEEVGIRHIAMT